MNKVTIYSLLALVVAIGLYLRVGIGLNWDEDQHLHPDERFLTMVTSDIQTPSSVAEYFNSEASPLSPYNKNYDFFVYGTFPIFLTKFVAVSLGQDGYWNVHILGRIISSIFDLMTIFLVFLIGRRLYSSEVGLIAAALMSCLVLNIQMSHFYGVEVQAAFFVVLTFYFCIPLFFQVLSRLPNLIWFISIGLSFGLALASKISSIFFLPIIALCGLIGGISYLQHTGFTFGRFGRAFLRQAFFGALLLFMTALMFRIFQPYAFQGQSFWSWSFGEKFLRNMAEIKQQMNGADMPPSIQWVNRPPFLYSFYNMVTWHFGALFGIVAWFSLAWAIIEFLRFRVYKHLPLIAWCLLWFTYQSTQFVKAGRYLLPIYPFFSILTAYGLVALGKSISKRVSWSLNERQRSLVEYSPTLIVCIFTLLWAVAFTNIYRKPVTRVAASDWIYDNIPCGSSIAGEHWDDGLPLRTKGRDGYGGCYKGIELSNYAPDNREKLEDTLHKLEAADYIILSSNRLYDSIPRLPKRFPFTIEYYKLLFSEALGFERVGLYTSYPNLFGLEFNDDKADESFTVYDHPKVHIFKKTPNFNIHRLRERLSLFPEGIMEPLVAGD